MGRVWRSEWEFGGKYMDLKKGGWKRGRVEGWKGGFEVPSLITVALRKELPSNPQCLPEGVSIVSIASIGVLLDIQWHPIRNVD